MRKVPLARLVIPFVCGLVIGSQAARVDHTGIALGLACMLVVVCFILQQGFACRYLFIHMLFGAGIMACAVLAGIRVYQSVLPTHSAPLGDREGVVAGWVADIPQKRSASYLLEIDATDFFEDTARISLSERIRVYIPSDSILDIVPGERWIFHGRLSRISGNGNPGEFDYRSYMLRKNCRYHLYVSSREHAIRSPDGRKKSGYLAARWRARVLAKWDQDNEDVAVLSALTLGYRPSLSADTTSAFQDAGAMHLLAVSGLHVGMIWWILDLLLRVPPGLRSLQIVKGLLIICLLWMYAGITGFSDSVTRSVTMFSIFSFSRMINRDGNIYNSLLLSAMILLIINPLRIVSPGFQLSYTAVFGIVSIQPVLARLYSGARRLPRRVFDLLSVSIAAQVATLPLVLLYFHQFPTWFILTNIVAIPLVSIILCLFTVSAPFLLILESPGFYSELLIALAGILRKLTAWIAGLPHAALTEIPMTLLPAILLAGVILCSALMLTYRRPVYLSAILVLAGVMIITSAVRTRIERGTRSVLVCNFRYATVLSASSAGRRDTYYLDNEPVGDPYVMEYIQSLARQPFRSDQHLLHDLDPAGTAYNSTSAIIAPGIWAVQMSGAAVLILGDGDSQQLREVLSAYPWDLVLFRRGIPRMNVQEVILQPGTIFLGDGTLAGYEKKMLRKAIPGITFLADDGAWSRAVMSRQLFRILN